MQLDSFSKVESWNGLPAPDGIEAVLEFDDRFGDRTKAAGHVLFELYEYRIGWPDPRGPRLVNPWSAPLTTIEQQKAHWDRASGAYSFRLACDNVQWNHYYVLSAVFDSDDGQRFFSQIVMQGQAPEKSVEPTTTESAAEPGRRIPQP